MTAGGDHPTTVCSACGTPGPAERRFCMNCGTPASEDTVVAGPPAPSPWAAPPAGSPVPPAAPPSYQPPSQPPYQPPSQPPVAPPPFQPPPAAPQHVPVASPEGRGRLALVVVVVLVLLGGGAAAGFLLLRDDEPTSANDRPAPAEPTDRPADRPTSDAPTSDEPTVDPVPATCWDGVEVDDLASCEPATGVEGRAYVFPAFDFAGEGCDPAPEHLVPTRRDHYSCPYLGSTDPLRYNVSEFDDHDAGVSYYTGDSGISPTAVGDLLRWDSTSGESFKTALLYRDGTWGITVYARDEVTRDDAVAELVRTIRPASDLAGTPR